jgi:hypothetical protein
LTSNKAFGFYFDCAAWSIIDVPDAWAGKTATRLRRNMIAHHLKMKEAWRLPAGS